MHYYIQIFFLATFPGQLMTGHTSSTQVQYINTEPGTSFLLHEPTYERCSYITKIDSYMLTDGCEVLQIIV